MTKGLAKREFSAEIAVLKRFRMMNFLNSIKFCFVIRQRSFFRFIYCWVWMCASLSVAAAIPDFESETKRWQWLEQVTMAAQSVDYQGVFVHSSEHYLLSMNVVHGYVDGRQREILRGLDGQPAQYFRQGNQVVQVDYGQVPKPIKAYNGFSISDLMVNRRQWKPYYKVQPIKVTRVADRQVYEINITAKTPDRYSYKVWLDQHSGVALGHLLLKNEKPLERLQFTQFQLLNSPSTDLMKTSKTNQKLWALLETEPSTESVLKPNSTLLSQLTFRWLPPGFTDQSHRKGFYTDGLASFSVFVDTLDTAEAMNNTHEEGVTSVVARELSGDYQLILVGELPIETLTKISEAAAFR
jgi:sigma-E factor negative regulatory protein RseB